MTLSPLPLRAACTAVSWCALLLSPGVAAASTDLVPVEQVGAAYARPQQRIDVGGGRQINLHCMGSGHPTVVFESGLSDWSNTWALIQPAVARTTRACSYDRPGMGYSDRVETPRTPAAVVEDLATLLDRAGIDAPVVLVGHSLGGFYAKLYAATHPGRVAGMVLVDPSEERLGERVGPALAARFGQPLVETWQTENDAGIAALIARFRDCARDARVQPLAEPRYRACTDPVRTALGAGILAERRRLQAGATYQDTQWRELADSLYGRHPEADARYARLFAGKAPLGALPLLVLTHGLWDMSEPTSELDFHAWRQAHALTAALSTRGEHRIVAYSRHNLQVENPGDVVDAITQVLAQVRAQR